MQTRGFCLFLYGELYIHYGYKRLVHGKILLSMLACMCTQLNTRTHVLLAIGLGYGVGRGCICSKRY